MDHALRRNRLASRLPDLGADAVLVTRLPNVRYLSGFTGSNGQVLVTAEGGTFFSDPRYEEQATHEVPDLARITYRPDFLAVFADACREAGARRVAFESNGVTHRFHQRLSETEGVELVPLTDELERLRWVKDAEEIALLERAQELTDEGFDRITAKLTEGMTERETALELEDAMRRAGAEAIGFDTIVAFGENAAEPHHHPKDRALRRGDVVKLDFGCAVSGYHSDMTRTVAFGEPAEEIREIHEIVRRAQEAGIAAVRAGVPGGDPDAAARGVIEDAGFGERFGHSLGHGVGLEVHEGPTLRKEGTDELPAGAVVTVEPGIYLPGVGGVRIEDTVVVGEGGARPLPRSTRELLVL